MANQNFVDPATAFEMQKPKPAAPVNPLAKYFRVPGLHIVLPSQGRFMGDGSVELSVNGEVAILPMRAADELLLKQPDALLNGHAIESLIESCVPGVKNVRQLATSDVDALLLAIRAATFGPTMTIEASCPECETLGEFEVHLTDILARIEMMAAEYPVRVADEILVYLRPYNFENATRATLTAFTEAKKVQGLEESAEEERQRQLNASFDKITRLNLSLLAECVLKVVVPDGEVVDRRQITEWVMNVDRNTTEVIEKALQTINKIGVDKSLPVMCGKCEHQWTTEVEFNPASFFAGSF